MEEAVTQAQEQMAAVYLGSFKEKLVESFKRTSKELNTTADKIQFTIKVNNENGNFYYEILHDWKKYRDAEFKKDFLGTVFDVASEQVIIENYLKYRLEGEADKHKLTDWSHIFVMFYCDTEEISPMLAIYVLKDAAKNEWDPVETIDIFKPVSGV